MKNLNCKPCVFSQILQSIFAILDLKKEYYESKNKLFGVNVHKYDGTKITTVGDVFNSVVRRGTRYKTILYCLDIKRTNIYIYIYLKRVIVTPAVYPRLDEPLHFDIQSTGQKSHCVNITL